MIKSHDELDVFRMAFEAAMHGFEISKTFPREETYSLTDQIRRSSRSVCSNIAEAWRKRRYEAALINKLSDAESEAGETQVWIRFAVECGYLSKEIGDGPYRTYDNIIGKLVNMIKNPSPWIVRSS